MTKKIRFLAALAFLAVSLTACSNESTQVQEPARTTAATTTTTAATTTTTTTTTTAPAESDDDTPDEPLDFDIETSEGETTTGKCSFDVTQLTAHFGTKASSETVEPEAAEPTTTTAGNTAAPSTTTAATTAPPVTVSGSLSDISKICGLRAPVETDISKCLVDVNSTVNPYDVIYDYGKDYDAFTAACDWSLAFDADYYMNTFPMLALQYHNDKNLLLKHFQTVGIHEGRQGKESFNVGTYKGNCSSEVSKAFGDNYEGYYFYYMMNYDKEKSVKTTGGAVQFKNVFTAQQAKEFAEVNAYRKDAGVDTSAYYGEISAFANYRAYVNCKDGYHAHDWFDPNIDTIREFCFGVGGKGVSENMCEYDVRISASENKNHADCYYGSDSHRKAMLRSENVLFGTGNTYCSSDYSCSFDVFVR